MQYGEALQILFHLIQKKIVNTTSKSSWNSRKTSSKHILEVYLSVLKVSEETISLHRTPLNAWGCSEAAESVRSTNLGSQTYSQIYNTPNFCQIL